MGHTGPMPTPPPGADPASSESDPLAGLAAQLVAESPRLAQALATGPILALGCTGTRVRRAGWLLTATSGLLLLGFVWSGADLLALGVAATLVPGCLLLGADDKQLAGLERRLMIGRLLRGR
jgi:hypothetical protein